MKIKIGAEVEIENPSAEIKKYCRENMRIKNSEYVKRLRFGFWLGNTPEYIDLYRENGDTLIIPVGCFHKIKNMLGSDIEYVVELSDDKIFSFDSVAVPLYDYQEKAVCTMAKIGFGILQSAAGSGKTQMGIALAVKLGYKTLWLTHTKDLLEQSYKRAALYMPKEWLGKICEGKVSIGKGITFATVQTLSRQDLSIYKHEFNTVIVDECHRVSGTPAKISGFGKVLASVSARHKIGLSATVHRSDGMIECCFAFIGGVAYKVPDSAVKNKILSVRIFKRCLNTPISESYLDESGVMLFGKFIEYLCGNVMRNAQIVNDLRANKGHRCLILSDRVAHLQFLKEMLGDERAVCINGKTSKKQREDAIENMRNGRADYLFATFSLAKEGLDIPCLDRLFLVTPHSDYAVVIQAVGRIARISEGKNEAVCYDYVDEKIGYSQRKFKERFRHYKKAGCVFG